MIYKLTLSIPVCFMLHIGSCSLRIQYIIPLFCLSQITAGKMEKIYLEVTYGKQAEAGKKEKVLEDYCQIWNPSPTTVLHCQIIFQAALQIHGTDSCIWEDT